jgi:hypothetical protein
MSHELATLLRRDHRELDQAIAGLAIPHADVSDEFCDALDGARLGLLAHHEAQDRVLTAALHTVAPIDEVHAIAARAVHDHLALERAMSALLLTTPHTMQWRVRVAQLRTLLAEHMQQEEAEIYPALDRALAPEIRAKLAAAYATERLRQLAELQPAACFPTTQQPLQIAV